MVRKTRYKLGVKMNYRKERTLVMPWESIEYRAQTGQSPEVEFSHRKVLYGPKGENLLKRQPMGFYYRRPKEAK